MQGGSETGVIRDAVALAASEVDERKRANLGYDTLVFAEKSADPGAWQQAFKGWAMVKSQLMEKTRVEGRAEGRTEGQTEEKQDSLLVVLAAKPDQPVPQDLAAAIQASKDLDQLRAWFAVAVRVGTVADFRLQTGL